MSEFDGANNPRLSGERSDPLFFNLYDGIGKELFSSVTPSPTPRQQQEGDFEVARLRGDYEGYHIGTVRDGITEALAAERVGALFMVRAEGKAAQRTACYISTDRLALVARLKTVDGVPLAKMISVFIGLNYKEIMTSNERGIVYGYLLPDNYYNTLVISPNGIVYREISRTQDSLGTYDITLGRITKANAPFRLPHRKFI